MPVRTPRWDRPSRPRRPGGRETVRDPEPERRPIAQPVQSVEPCVSLGLGVRFAIGRYRRAAPADAVGGETTLASESEPKSDGNDTVIVGIPAYNESVTIGSIVLQARRYADEVIVVDDGSSDDTVAIAEDSGATVIEHGENRGKGKAIRTLLAHVQNAELDALVLLDGDGQHLPSDIPAVVAPVLEGTSDIAIGSRYLERNDTETPAYRRFGQRVLDFLTLGSSGTNLSDTQSGFRALSSDAVSELNIRTDGMGVESEMIASAVEHELRVVEIPIDVRYDDVDGQTHHPLRHGLMVATFVLQLIRDRHPLLFFGVPALILLSFGGVGMVHSAYLYQATGAFHQWRILLSGFVLLLGTLSLFCGLVLSQVRNMIDSVDE